MEYSAIILAAGSGSRMKLGYNKMLYKIKGKPLITLTIQVFIDDPLCRELIVVVNEKETEIIKNILQEYQVDIKKITIAIGSYERQYSVYNGLKHVTSDLVLVHDGARPFITHSLIKKLVNEASKYGCSIPAVKVKDTIKMITNSFVQETIPRENLYGIQTPQVCKLSLLKKAHQLALEENYLGTDEASLIEKYTDNLVKIIEASYDNIKITTLEDIKLAEILYDKYYK